MFFGHERPPGAGAAMCLLCNDTMTFTDGSASSLLSHLQEKHQSEYEICREVIDEEDNDQHGDDTVVFHLSAVEEMDAVEEEGDKSSSLSAEVKEELSDVEVKAEFIDVKGVISNEEDEECVANSEDDSDTDEYYEPPAGRNRKTDSLSNSEAAATSNILQGSNIQQPQAKAPLVCHRCKKHLADNETINNERAGAPTPKGKVDYDYCWDCFATLRQIGFTEEHYNVVEIKFDNHGSESKDIVPETDGSEASVHKKYTFDTYQKNMKHGVFKNGLYHCKVCQKSYSKATTLQKHSELHRQKDTYLCSICSKEFTRQAALLEHELRHAELLPEKCNVCGKTFASKYKLKRHETVHTKEKSFKCVYCEKLFSDKSSMVHHMRTHTGKKMYRCRTCSESFVTHYQRMMHEKAKHVNSRDFVFCDTYGKNFPYKSKLDRHKRIHTGEKPYDCDFCEKSFVEKSKMVHHMSKMHTGDMLFPCKTCSESFMTHYHRAKHEKAIHEPL